MNRRGFLAVLLGAPIAAKLAPEVRMARRATDSIFNVHYHYTQEMRVPFGWREKDGRRVDGVLFNYDGVDRKTYRG